MKIKLLIILTLFAVRMCGADELTKLISSEIKIIIEREKDVYPDEASRINIEKIYNLIKDFQKKLMEYDKRDPTVNEKEIKIKRDIFLIVKDFSFIMANHNIDYLTKEIRTIIEEIENSYGDIMGIEEKTNMNLSKGIPFGDNFCTIFMRFCQETCWKPPRIYMKSFNCNVDNKTYNCECGKN